MDPGRLWAEVIGEKQQNSKECGIWKERFLQLWIVKQQAAADTFLHAEEQVGTLRVSYEQAH